MLAYLGLAESFRVARAAFLVTDWRRPWFPLGPRRRMASAGLVLCLRASGSRWLSSRCGLIPPFAVSCPGYPGLSVPIR